MSQLPNSGDQIYYNPSNSNRGLADTMARGDQDRIDQMILAPLLGFNKSNTQIPQATTTSQPQNFYPSSINPGNQFAAGASPSQGLLQSTSSIAGSLAENIANPGGYQGKGMKLDFDGQIQQQISQVNLANGIQTRSYESFTPMSSASQQNNYMNYLQQQQQQPAPMNSVQISQPNNIGGVNQQQQNVRSVHEINVQSIVPGINLAATAGNTSTSDRELRENIVKQVRDSQQMRQQQQSQQQYSQQEQQESSFSPIHSQQAIQQQLQQKQQQQQQQQLQQQQQQKQAEEEEANRRQQQQQQQQQQNLLRQQQQQEQQQQQAQQQRKEEEEQKAQLKQRQQQLQQQQEQQKQQELQKHQEHQLKLQRKHEELQQQQQQQNQQHQQEQVKRAHKQQQQQQPQPQQQQQQLGQTEEDESELQRQYLEQQQQQEEYYGKQLESQRKKILDQQQMLEQMKAAMIQQQQQQQQSQNNKSALLQSSAKRSQTGKQSTTPYQPQSAQKERTISSSNLNIPNADQANERRLELIETSLNRVCNQHDALMPLLQLLETMPSLQRSEQQIKNLTKKYTDIEKKLKEIEGSEKKDQQYQHIFSNIERNFKNTHQQIAQLRKDLVGLETTVVNVQSIPEAKVKEDSLNLYRQVDQKLDRNLKDVKSLLANFKNQMQLEVKRGGYQGEGVEDDQDGLQQPVRIMNEVNRNIDTQEKAVQRQIAQHQRYLSENSGNTQQSQLDIDMANIYREIGMLRTEMELLSTQQRQDVIQHQLQRVDTNDESAGQQDRKQLFIASLEQNMYLQETEVYDTLNYQRIQNDLESLHTKLQYITDSIVNQKIERIGGDNDDYEDDAPQSDAVSSASQHLLVDHYNNNTNKLQQQQQQQQQSLKKSELLGYELRFIGDRIFNLKQQIHGTKKKYLCDTRRLEDRLQALEQMNEDIQENNSYQDSQAQSQQSKLMARVCDVASVKERVETLNNSISKNVSSLVRTLSQIDSEFTHAKRVYKQANPDTYRNYLTLPTSP